MFCSLSFGLSHISTMIWYAILLKRRCIFAGSKNSLKLLLQAKQEILCIISEIQGPLLFMLQGWSKHDSDRLHFWSFDLYVMICERERCFRKKNYLRLVVLRFRYLRFQKPCCGKDPNSALGVEEPSFWQTLCGSSHMHAAQLFPCRMSHKTYILRRGEAKHWYKLFSCWEYKS